MLVGPPTCPLELHSEVRRALAQEYGMPYDSPAIAKISAPQITAVEPGPFERAFKEDYSLVWTQFFS